MTPPNAEPKGAEAKCTCGPAPVMHDGCGYCVQKRRLEAWKRLTPEQKAYDRYVDPQGAYSTDFDSCCYCHISPPCHHCINSSQDEEGGEA